MKLKEARSKPSTVGTRTGSEALRPGVFESLSTQARLPERVPLACWPGCGRQAGWEQRSPQVIKTHQVEPVGARGKILHLTFFRFSAGEISSVRAEEKSAEAVVCAEQRIVQEG